MEKLNRLKVCIKCGNNPTNEHPLRVRYRMTLSSGLLETECGDCGYKEHCACLDR